LSKEGIYGKTARYDRDFLVSTENKKYKVTHLGDLCYNPANLKFGVICLNTYGDAIFSPIYVTFEIEASFDPDFIGAYLTRWDFINRALKYQQGTVYERMAVSPEDFVSIKCCFPQKAEQTRLAEFITLLDKRIAAQGKYVESLKKYKRGLLSSVFSQNVSLFSTAAFYAFSELAVRRSEKYDPKCNAHAVCIELEHIEQETGRIIGSTCADYQNSIKTVCKPGDVMFGKLRPYLRKYAFVQKECVCSSEIWSLIPTDIVIPKYLFYLIQSEAFMKAANVSSGTKMPRAEWSTIAKSGYPIPSKDDQQATVDILETTDRIIVSHVASYDRLIEYKKGLLQRLFI
jgi:type I restriction enzyme S subunit